MIAKYRTHYRLWAMLSAIFLVGLCLAEYRYDPTRGLVVGDFTWVRRGFPNFFDTAPYFALHLTVMLSMAAAGGWSAHALLVLYGVTRLSSEAADYDDALLADLASAEMEHDVEMDTWGPSSGSN
jgi:hypothetical protein